MEKLRKLVSEIAYTSQAQIPSKLSPLQRSLIPFLSFASSLYRLALSLRHRLYYLGLFRRHRLPVPVISVGNLTWGGNGKTPMVEYIALQLADYGISPLVLTRGYAGGDEANMLRRHLIGTSAKTGAGANRAATAAEFLERHGYVDPCMRMEFSSPNHKMEVHQNSGNIGVVILDDGMQHLSLFRDMEIVMVNGLMPWGNCELLPLGPLREPLTALERANAVVVHHADLASEQNLKDLVLMIRNVKASLPIFFSKMSPSYFFHLGDIKSKMPLQAVCNRTILCVSAIGFSNAFVQGVEKLGPLRVDRLDFNDHHLFHEKDVDMIRKRLEFLKDKFVSDPVVVTTEKDYDRDPKILELLNPFEVLILGSHLQIIPCNGDTEDSFMKMLKQLMSSES